MSVESKGLVAATRSLESSEQTQQHQSASDTQQILTETHGDCQGVVGKGGASTESDWVISVNSFREKLNSSGKDDTMPSIYRVPKNLRGRDDKAYVPQIVSLGPYHHGKKGLLPMERHKMRALKVFLKRKNKDIKIYLDTIKKLEREVRDCYEGPINMYSNEFVQMLVLDGCFVIELFRFALGGSKEQCGCGRTKEFVQLDPAFAMPLSMNLKLIQRDMIMLENQIPLFVLNLLLGLQLGCKCQRGRVAKRAVKFFRQLMPAEEFLTKSGQNRCLVAKLAVNFFCQLMPAKESLTKTDQNTWESSPEGSTAFDPLSDGGLHFLDVFRRSLLQTRSGPVTRSPDHAKRPLRPIRCVTELRDAGIKFKKRDSDRFWDIEFKKGVLEIPKLLIDDGTKSLFLNVIAFEQRRLVAFEQTRHDGTNSFSSYVLFMDHLIDSSEDVRHLHDCGIIEHWLGNDDKVAKLFDHLWREVVFDIDNRHFSGLSDKVNEYCSHRRHRWRAYLKHKHCSNPWAIISVIGAVVLLLLTLTQTFYAFYGYYRPS